MKFLNGYKTIIGAIGTCIGVFAPNVAPELFTHVDNLVTGAFGMLTVLGIIHKGEKSK